MVGGGGRVGRGRVGDGEGGEWGVHAKFHGPNLKNGCVMAVSMRGDIY